MSIRIDLKIIKKRNLDILDKITGGGCVDRLIYLTKGRVTVVDEEDYDNLSQYKWHYSIDGYPRRSGSLKDGELRHKSIFMHRVIMGESNNLEIDHINGDKLDNRKANLRFATRQQNIFNRRKWAKKTSSQYKGVFWCSKVKKWVAMIRFNYKIIFIGHYYDEVEAAKAYNKKAYELFGEYAKMNGCE